MDKLMEKFVQDIRDSIAEVLEENPGAPETDVTREVVECMLLGEDARTQRAIRQRFGLRLQN
jgi:hypothetical protein